MIYFYSLFLAISLFAYPTRAFSSDETKTISNNSPFDELKHFEEEIDHTAKNDLENEWTDHAELDPNSFQKKFFNMLFILGLLIGFMILASWALKRLMKTKVHQLNTSSSIKVLETRYLSPRATIYLLAVEDQVCLIAESPTNITFLKSYPSYKNSSSSVENDYH